MTRENPYEPPPIVSAERRKITEIVPSKVDDAREWVSLLVVILVVAVIAATMIATAAAIGFRG